MSRLYLRLITHFCQAKTENTVAMHKESKEMMQMQVLTWSGKDVDVDENFEA